MWILGAAGLSRAFCLLTSIATARLLGAEPFGELGILQSTVGVFSVFAGLRLGLTATGPVAELVVTDPERARGLVVLSARVSVCLGLVLALGLLLFARPLAVHALDAPHLEETLRIGALLILLGAVNGAQTRALAGFEAFKTIARINLRTGLASCVLMMLGVLLAGLPGAVWSLAAGLFVNCLLNHLALRAEAGRAGVALHWTGGGADWRSVCGFTLPAVFCGIIILPVSWAALTLLVHQSEGYQEMGIVNAAS